MHNNIKNWFEQIRLMVDCHQVAEKVGLKRHSSGNYSAPNRPDVNPSLSIFDSGKRWKDHTTNETGSCIDLLIYASVADNAMGAAKILGEWFGIPQPTSQQNTPQVKQQSTEAFIASQCLKSPEQVIPYLTGRGIDKGAIETAIKRRTLGFNDYVKASVKAGEYGYGGDAAAFIVYNEAQQVVAVDSRYIAADLNGGVKTQCRGKKAGYYWTSCQQKLKRARTVYIVESPINALSVETAFCHYPSVAAIAVLGVGNAQSIDFAFLKGKKVLIGFDHTDPVEEKTNIRPGMDAAYQLYDRLTAEDIAARLVDMLDWKEGEDINDYLQNHGQDELLKALKKIDHWLIAGMPSVNFDERQKGIGRKRVYLPPEDLEVYWRYKVRDDFIQYIDKYKDDYDDEGETSRRKDELGDLCAFRIASVSRLSIQGYLATVNGVPDVQPETVFVVTCQMPRHGNVLQRAVVNSKTLSKLDWWISNFGYVFKPQQFTRMLVVLDRSTELSARDGVNYIGVAWRDGKLAALEGKDCYFTEPAKQCLYHNMTFPRGLASQATEIINSFQKTFDHNAALIPFVWGLGAHLKAIFGYYPHFQMQAEKGSGKSKLLESMQSALSFQVLSGQMLKTDHRRRASVSYTSHPVGWDEYSKLPQNILKDIDSLLQSTYRFEYTMSGAALTPYVMCAPVMLAGEEVDVESLQSKICRSTLSVKKQGPELPSNISQFPVWQWLQFIASLDPSHIRKVHQQYFSLCQSKSRSDSNDATAKRMLQNYACILTAWVLLSEFVGFSIEQGDFIEDLLKEMNDHLTDTDGTRLPWVWIMEILFSEIEASRFAFPYFFDYDDGEMCIYFRAAHVMDHLSTAQHLKPKFDALPIKTGRIFKRQLLASGLVKRDDAEKTCIHTRKRYSHLICIPIKQLEKLGLYIAPEKGELL